MAMARIVSSLLLAAVASAQVLGESDSLALLQTHAGVLTDDDVTAISLDDVTEGTPPDCEPAKRMDIGKASVGYSNLGGLGPDTASPEGILFTNVLADSGKLIDLHVSAISEYTPKNQNGNGKINSFGRVNVATGSSVTLEFAFQDGSTHMPIVMDPFTMTFVDLDEQKDEGYGRESITIHDEHEYIVTANSAVQIHTEDGATVFTSTQHGVGMDNPREAMMLTQAQKDKSFQAIFPSVSMFTVTFAAGAISPDWAASARNILFAGQSNQMCPPDEPLPPAALCETMVCPAGWKLKKAKRIAGLFCEAETCTVAEDLKTCCQADLCSSVRRLTLGGANGGTMVRNNLGNTGPDTGAEGMLFDNVFPNSGDNINMLVNAGEGYVRNEEANNGIRKKVGRINLATGATADLTFSFIDAATGAPKAAGPFWMSFLDFDEQQDSGKAREFLTLYNFNNYRLTKTSVVTAIKADAKGDAVTFTSSTFGDGEDNVHSTMEMTNSQKDKSVSVSIPNVESFRATFRIADLPNGNNYRNLQFAGATNLVC